ncbi:MAG: GspE/PulE family protein [Phycisphaerales bacterium]
MTISTSTSIDPDKRFLETVSHDFAREHLILWVNVAQGESEVLHASDTHPAVLHNTSVVLGSWPSQRVVDASELAAMIDSAYAEAKGIAASDGGLDCGSEDTDELIGRVLRSSDADLLSTSGKAPIVKLLDGLLFEGIRRGASDIHFQPSTDEVLIRYRIDGALVDAHALPGHLAGPIVSRIKIMGHMDIAETRMPQDGRASVTIGQAERSQAHEVDLRISTLPTSEGERVVIRFLDTNRGQRLGTLDAIGMPEDILRSYRIAASRPNGIVLLTGPTGSGKTTTLYATLRELASSGGAIGGGELNIMTIEDPIEYRLNAQGLSVSQSQVNRNKGVTFASGLRHILRQDPDVVMVGEIRDAETAQMAIQSSLTGHLVFSTLHTNDSVSAPPRLIDLGIEPYLISAALTAVLAQRLVRLTHANCDGSGCEECMSTGYVGRAGIFELLTMNEPVRELVARSASAGQIREAALAGGWRSLREDGRRLIEQGLTTSTEIERVAVDLGEEVTA